MGTLKMTGCMKLVSSMDEADQDALLGRLDQYQKDGVPAARAQVMAASDTLAELEAERKEFMAMLREQHPDLFTISRKPVDTSKSDIKRSAPRFTEDIPNESWLKGKIDYARSSPRNEFGVPKMSTVTGYFSAPVMFPARWASELKGERGEQNNVRKDDLASIRKVLRETGKMPLNDDGKEYVPYIEIGYDGKPWVSEGNHRIMAAAAEGWDYIPAEVRYFDGGQRRAGKWAPDNLADITTRHSEDIKATRARDITETPEFKRWFGDSKVVDAAGKPMVVYRGEHGSTADGDLQTVIGTYTFTEDPDVASTYAQEPNDYSMTAAQPRVVPAYLRIENPIIDNQNDPFVEFADLEKQLGRAQAESFARKHSGAIENTNNWEENYYGDYDDVNALLDEDPNALSRLYIDAFQLLDDPEFVKAAKGAGYDGGIHIGNGESATVLEYRVFDKSQIKSAAGNNGEFDASNPDITKSASRNSLGFYSALAKGIEDMPTKAAPAGAWKSQIKGLVNKGVVKQDEVTWSGIEDFLDLQQGKVTKEQISDYLKSNGVQVQEVTLGDAALSQEENSELSELEDLNRRRLEGQEGVMDDSELVRLRELLAKSRNHSGSKYGKYTLPGGENYREVLLTLPESMRGVDAIRLEELNRLIDAKTGPESGYGNLSDDERRAIRAEVKPLRDERTGLERKKIDYQSAHWEQPNVLAHIRLNDRTDADGNKVLFVEEIQSDWGQDGKKKGFKRDVDRDAIESKMAAITARLREIAKSGVDDSPELQAEWNSLSDEKSKLTDELVAANSGVPVAPFVTKTEGWLNLALKRVITMAAEGGYDKVAFVNGEQSAERYDLSKHIDQVTVFREESGAWHVFAWKDGRSVFTRQGWDFGDVVEASVGKEIASKVHDLQPGQDRRIEGLDLKVGGEGMKTFYDSIVPNAVKKLLPKLGGERLGSIEIDGPDATPRDSFAVSDRGDGSWALLWRPTGEVISMHATKAEAKAALNKERSGGLTTQPGFDITDKMREQVEGGVPLFSKQRNGDRYVTQDEINEMHHKAYADLQSDPEYKRLSADVAAAEEAQSQRWHKVLDKSVEILKSRPGFKEIAQKYDPKTVRNLAQVFVDEAQTQVPEPTPSVRDALHARQAYVDHYLSEVAGIPEPREFAEQANQHRDYYDSPAFRRWFKQSKVVDQQGSPLVAFHVTTKDFVEFDTSAGEGADKKSHAAYSGQLGSWFTAPSLYRDNYDAGNAEVAVEQFGEDESGTSKPGANTMPVHLSIQNPMEYSDFESMLEDRDSFKNIAAYKADLVKQGYDGIVIRNSDTDGAVDRDDWVAFNSTQIKSAIGNNGDFDPTNPDIRKSAQRQVDTPEFKRWFGDSKVVDENGQPMVVYHGTVVREDTDKVKGMGDIQAFDRMFTTKFRAHSIDTVGSWFSTNPGNGGAEMYSGNGSGSAIYPVYLSIKNPQVTTFQLMTRRARLLANGKDDGRKIGQAEVDAYRKWLADTGKDGVKIEGSGNDGSTEFDNQVAWIALEPEQIKSAVGNNGEFDPGEPDIRKSNKRTTGDYGRQYTPQQLMMFEEVGRTTEKQTLIDRVKEARKDLGKKMVQGIVDQFRPLKDLGGKAYTLARLSKGSPGAFEALLKHGKLSIKDGAYDADLSGGFIDTVGKPLGRELEDFMWWVASHRAERLSLEDREHLFTPESIAAGKSLADGELDFDYLLSNGATTRDRILAYNDSLKKFDAFNKNVLDIAEQSGLIDGDSRQYWDNEFYVPFYRVSEEEGEFMGPKIKGGLARQRAFQELKGGSQKLNSDLLANTMKNWAHLIDASAKNRAAKETLESAVKVGIALESDAETVRQIGKSISGKGGTVWFMDSGQQRHFLVGDPYLLDAINSLEYSGMRGPLMDAMSSMKHWLTVGVTASPAFKVRNLIRDSIQAMSISDLSYNPITNFAEGKKASARDSQEYVSALASGGLVRFGTMLEGNGSERVRMLVKRGVKSSTILDSEGKVQDFYNKYIQPGIEAYEELGNRGEEINRAALYSQLRKKGIDHAEAALMARDLMDFSMQGTFASIRFLTQVVPFMNARLQGLYKLGRGAAEDPRRFALVTGAVALTSIALMGAFGDDDDWKKREDWDRDQFWWFKFGGTAFRIPKPFEIGAIATLAERGVELFTNNEFTAKRFGDRVLHLLGDNLAMNPIPQAVKPIVDVYANKDSFSGRPIESMSMERLQSEYRYGINTSMVARGVSSAMNATTRATIGKDALSPVQIDSLLQGYFGWLGSFVIAGADMAIRPMTNEPARPQADYFKVVTQGFVKQLPEPGSKYVSAMYDQAKVIEEAYATHRQMVKEGKVEEARSFAAENKDVLDRYHLIEAVKKTETHIGQQIHKIEMSDMTPAQKREEIQKLHQQQDLSARKVY